MHGKTSGDIVEVNKHVLKTYPAAGDNVFEICTLKAAKMKAIQNSKQTMSSFASFV